MAELKDRLKLLREEVDMVHKQLAAKIGVARNTVTAWENGTRTPEFDHIKKLAAFFEVKVGYLIGETDNRTGTGISGQQEEDTLDKLLAELKRRRNLSDNKVEWLRNVLSSSLELIEANEKRG